jgi:predicted Rossmann fold flavoprotein
MSSKTFKKEYDVIVLGGGAAGLMAAITAANRGRHVLVLEKSNKIGKKILMSGGGKCNFTNRYIESYNFVSQNNHFMKSALSKYTADDFISLVESYSINYEIRKHNQLFCTESSKDILNILSFECQRTNVEIQTQIDIIDIEKILTLDSHVKYNINLRDNTIRFEQNISTSCKSLIIATGGLSIPTLGGSGYGYELAKCFSMPITSIDAGLVPLTFNNDLKNLCNNLAGVSIPVTVKCNNQFFNENLLFTHRGMSGPVILQISNYWNSGAKIQINLIPNEDMFDFLKNAKHTNPDFFLSSILGKLMPKSLVSELAKLWRDTPVHIAISSFDDDHLLNIANKINNWEIIPFGTEGYKKAEVTKGGIDTDNISSKTMESKYNPGLYFVGEVLDVTGQLGGFNFQWAWSSGYVAGMNA